MPATAKPYKLRSGAWGARVEGRVNTGDTITITTQGGKSWQARVERVVWTDGKIALCATASLDRPAKGETTQRGICAHCGDHCSPRFRTCRECAHGGQSYYDSGGNFVLGTDD